MIYFEKKFVTGNTMPATRKGKTMATKKTSVVIIGAGRFSYRHVGCMLQLPRTTHITGFVEPAEAPRANMRRHFEKSGKPAPPFYNTIREFLRGNGGPADCAVIVTPHKFHARHAIECMRAGMDVLVEKPMVLNTAEARRVMRVRDQTGRLCSVAFPASYSPAVRKAKQLIAAGVIGDVMSIAGHAHQNWMRASAGTWRQDPEISGGGFLFDTGSHLINTVVDLAGADVRELCALQDDRGAPVEITSAIAGRFRNNIFFSLCAEGNSVNCQARIFVIGTKGVLITDTWGNHLHHIKDGGKEGVPVKFPASIGVWEQFLRVRAGKLDNPCPAETGLRFARLMDLVRAAAAGKKTCT